MPETRSADIEKLQDAQNQDITAVAFGGGGAKGIINPGPIQVLEDEGIICGLKAVAGSSAGAITAACVATGITSKAFAEISATTNMKGLLGSGVINRDGAPLYALLQRTILRNVSGFIKENNIEDLCAERIEQLTSEREDFYAREQILLKRQVAINTRKTEILRDQAENVVDDAQTEITNTELQKLRTEEVDIAEDIEIIRSRGNGVKEWINILQDILLNRSESFKELKSRCSQGGKIYFKDLTLMRAIDPTKFKYLAVTGVRRDNGELIIFSPKTTPDIEIALACRASASIPVIVKPVEMKIKINGIKQKKEIVDGGVKNNLPTEYATDLISEITNNQEKKGRTLALTFGTNKPDDPIHIALYSAKPEITNMSGLLKFAVDALLKFVAKIGGASKYSESEEALMQKLRKDSLNVLPLDTKEISTLSFSAAQAQADYLRIQGVIQTERHLENMELRAPNTTFKEREFLLEVIESTGKDRKKSWTASAKDSIEDKATALLSFCEEGKWKGNDKSDVLEQFVALASINRRTGKASSDTSTIDHLVKALNQKTVSINIVKEFMSLTEKTDGKPFVKSDFDKIIERNMNTNSRQQGMVR